MNSPLDPASQPTPGNSAGTPRPTPGPTPGASPGPKPDVRPGVHPGAVPRPSQIAKNAAGQAASPVPSQKQSDPSKFGRVEEDGTAWVKGLDGSERQIGQFKAGTPEEGLRHFATRYEDLATEVSLLENRVRKNPDEAPQVRQSAENLRESLATVAVIGDLPALDQRLARLLDDSAQAEEKSNQAKQDRRAQSIARKEALAAEAEDIGENSTDWKAAGERLREMLQEWKTIRGVDRTTDDALWNRYSAGRDAFSRRRGAHFSELDRNRGVAKQKKEELVERAEALMNSVEWGETARAFKDLMQEWKAAGRATREADDSLWERFKAAQDKFFDARKADSAKKDSEFEANADAKQALLDEYDSKINPEQGIDKARQQLRELNEKWDEIGFVPRARIREFDQKIGALESRVTDAADAEWRRTDPEALARVAQFQAKVDQFTKEAEAAEAKGNEKKATQLRAQAAQWQEWADAAASATEN